MGKPNIVTKRYMQDNARFADLCNFYLFNGQQVIKPEDLAERDVTELALPKGLESAEAIDLLNICIDAKLEIEKDLEKGVGNVCKGIEELKDMAREEGMLVILLQLVRDGLLDLSVGVERSGISEAEFKERLKQLA